MKLPQQIEEEIQNEKPSYESKITTHCVWCGARKQTTFQSYMEFGNACPECSKRFSRVLEGFRGARKNRAGILTGYKIRNFTDEEVVEMIEERINYVKENNLHL